MKFLDDLAKLSPIAVSLLAILVGKEPQNRPLSNLNSLSSFYAARSAAHKEKKQKQCSVAVKMSLFRSYCLMFL